VADCKGTNYLAPCSYRIAHIISLDTFIEPNMAIIGMIQFKIVTQSLR